MGFKTRRRAVAAVVYVHYMYGGVGTGVRCIGAEWHLRPLVCWPATRGCQQGSELAAPAGGAIGGPKLGGDQDVQGRQRQEVLQMAPGSGDTQVG